MSTTKTESDNSAKPDGGDVKQDVADSLDKGGFAEHMNFCPHVPYCVVEDLKVEDCPDFTGTIECSVKDCKNTKQNWYCLQCRKVFCGRYAKGHMKEHFEKHDATEAGKDKSHGIACGLGDLSFWCFACDSYVNHLTLPGIWRTYVTFSLAKFGEKPPIKPQFWINKREEGGPVPTRKSQAQLMKEYKVDNTAHVEGLTKEELTKPLVDRALGLIYGQCLGDAVGLSTEFLTKKQATTWYKDGKIPFPFFDRNAHNIRFVPGDWTDDSDQMILIMQSLLECKKVDVVDFAKKLHTWIKKGFAELGDYAGQGLGATVAAVALHKDFFKDPHAVARDVWEKGGKRGAANGAVMRTSVVAVYEHEDLKKVAANTRAFATVTHADPRCVESSVAITMTLARLLKGEKASTVAECESLMKDVLEDVDVKSLGEWKESFLEHMNHKTLADLKLDEKGKIGYTLKCFACGFYALKFEKDFKTMLNQLCMEAGDTDTNAAVAGAVFGAKHGYAKLPQDWVNAMPHKKWLDKQIVAFLKQCKIL